MSHATHSAAPSVSSPDAPPPSPRTFPAKRAALIVTLALGILALAFLLHRRDPQPAPAAPALRADAQGVTLAPNAPQWKYVELAAARSAPALAPLPVPGRVDFDEKRTANLGAPLAGRVESVRVQLGDSVKAGDRLFSVRSAALADLAREVASAREEVAVKARLAQRSRELLGLKATAEKDVLEAEAELTQAQLSLKAALAKQSSLTVAPEGENLYWVRSPRAGTVVELDVHPGAEVGPERERPLVRVADLDELRVLADVSEADAADLAQGGAVRVVTQDAALERPGVIEHLSEVVDPQRRTLELRVRVPNADHALRPNAFVEVALAADPSTQRVRVPEEAVVSEGEQSLVFVARAPDRLERVPVVTGRRRGGEVELRSGLEPGARYVARGALLLLNQIDLAD
ncbi:efflux RND transporter periplasmic adaptor subunit [Aggregicoccus sp. 17bor-14]|uniref:efflux RND transporter periplasmic adaptor subunit n=1 Tax=Myxococcaceae TaxID=31 RepID=UPI00129C63AF|nr:MULTISPECIES: efflux RND transporter periplasmic adaptor subunit [Myxococcaceae]MBF5041149.1 efflux RND transporter periplasmic adaptor subunit [Simulacricoccus sp. 17bor-14]MRI86936.1 efflux RND transporter periplasmic adaptor subunit [Aggregicoccus sp. 17bor-14]